MIGNAGRARSYALPVVSWTQIPVPLRRWAYRFASGLLLVYRLLRRPTFTGVKCVLTDGDLVLLVRHTYGQREWLLPGGSLKRDEPPLGAARREMREELGIDIADWTALGELTAYTERGRDRLHCFQAELRDPALTLDPGELESVGWFPRAELPPDLGRFVRPILVHALPAREN
jgi:8-oxo-dGTP pyrophosphatase MutT (NUDIX family)